MKFRGGEFSTGTTGDFQSELTISGLNWFTRDIAAVDEYHKRHHR
jgi:hypothetical protein